MTTGLLQQEIRLIQVDARRPRVPSVVIHFSGGPFDGRRELAASLPRFHALRARRGRVRRWLGLPRRNAVYLRRETWLEDRGRHARYVFDGFQRLGPRQRP